MSLADAVDKLGKRSRPLTLVEFGCSANQGVLCGDQGRFRQPAKGRRRVDDDEVVVGIFEDVSAGVRGNSGRRREIR